MPFILRSLTVGIAAFAITNAPVFAQEMPRILADAETSAKYPLPDFSYAGYGFGIEPIPEVKTVIKISDHGAIPDDGKDDSAAIKAALAAANDSKTPVRTERKYSCPARSTKWTMAAP